MWSASYEHTRAQATIANSPLNTRSVRPENSMMAQNIQGVLADGSGDLTQKPTFTLNVSPTATKSNGRNGGGCSQGRECNRPRTVSWRGQTGR